VVPQENNTYKDQVFLTEGSLVRYALLEGMLFVVVQAMVFQMHIDFLNAQSELPVNLSSPKSAHE
jgi:hypothetical protein